ncbi:hypothetical protein RNI52_24030 [Labrys neptuniae]|uniref:Uncharacterized protein n=1 Tax=Labrys neptuniae TaxID=376174 RepID=A0ABV3PQY6_9HYPH|nr:hypothetical protein [Labrys neptuniae]MDT3380414.1 hypothetical protein [Labrys neptuniae]
MENDIYTTALLALGGLFIGLGLVIAILWGSAAWERRRLSRRRHLRPLSFAFAASEWDASDTDAPVGSGDGHGGCGHGDGGH